MYAMTNLISESQVKAAPTMWVGVNCLLVLIECVLILTQLHHPGVRLWSLHFFYLPVAVTVPYSVISPLYLRARSGEHIGTDQGMEGRLSYVAVFSMLVTYITLLICLGEFL